MQPSIKYLNLLDEINHEFEEPDWLTVSQWIESRAPDERVRHEPFLPVSVETLSDRSDPVLYPGDIVRTSILSRQAEFHVPPHCQLGDNLLALGSLTIGEGVTIMKDVLAQDTIRWAGGAQSSVRNVVARHIHLDASPGSILGGVWCDSFDCAVEGVDLPPDCSIRGVVVVDEPLEGRLTIGAHSQIGGLYVKGHVETQARVTVSYMQAKGDVSISRNNHIGYIQANEVEAASNCQLGVILSDQNVQLAEGCVVDTIRAHGDIVLDESVIVTGNTLLSEKGDFYIKPHTGWHSQRQHWFYVLPGDELQPYVDDMPRPSDSKLLIIRGLTHSLWKQIERLAGRR